jgi:drug/metabolite transporter (DMT)-like permease
MTANRIYLGYGLAAAGAALFSTKAIFIKLAFQDDVNASLMLALRMGFALPFFIGIGLWAWMKRKSEARPQASLRIASLAALTGFLGYYLSALLDFSGLQYISAQLERLVLFTYPLFVMFLGAAFFQQKITRGGILAALVTYLGLAIVFGLDLPEGGRATIIGTAMVLGAAVTFAFYQLVAKGFITALGSALFTSISLTSSGFMCIIHHLVVSGDFSASPRFIWLSAACAIVATVIPSFLINAGMARISPQAVAMISTLSPLITIVLAVWILDEPFTLADAIGSAMVIAGVGLYAWTESRPERMNQIPT